MSAAECPAVLWHAHGLVRCQEAPDDHGARHVGYCGDDECWTALSWDEMEAERD